MEHDTRRPDGQTSALNTGRVPKRKLNIDCGGGSFTVQVIRDHKTNTHWYHTHYSVGACLLSHKAMR